MVVEVLGSARAFSKVAFSRTMITSLSSLDRFQPFALTTASRSLLGKLRSSASWSPRIDLYVLETTPHTNSRMASCHFFALAIPPTSLLSAYLTAVTCSSAAFQNALNLAISKCCERLMGYLSCAWYFSGIWYMQRAKSVAGKAIKALTKMPS